MATIDGMTTENWVAHYVGHKGNSGNNAIVAKIESLQAALNRQIEADELKEPNMTRVKPLVIMILLGCVVALQVTILRGNFGEGMQRASEGSQGQLGGRVQICPRSFELAGAAANASRVLELVH